MANLSNALLYRDREVGGNIDLNDLTSATKAIFETIGKDATRILPDQDEIKQQLKEDYHSEKLVPVLGAGISLEYGLPNWNTLLQALLARTFQTSGSNSKKALLFAEVFSRIFEPSPLIAARYLSQEFQGQSQGFEEAVKMLLYDQINETSTSNLMSEMVQLAAAPGRSPNLDSIITFNFDDILEYELEKASVDVPFRSIYTVGQNADKNELSIFHVHGFIPRSGTLKKENTITLGEDLYHQQYTNVYSWSNLVQLSKYTDRNCLFIGTSFTDPNLRRLLDIANAQRGDSPPRHYIIRKLYTQETVAKRLRSLLEDNHELFDEKIIASISFEELAHEMTASVHKFDEKDALSLGVRTIWIEDFPEIPEVLQAMRTSP